MRTIGITDSVLEEIKARIDLADLISSYGIEVKNAGGSKKACCPFHNEKTPSFNINESKGLYHCFGCGKSGDAIKFVQEMEGLSFIDAVKKLAEQCGVKIEEREDPTAGRRKRLLALMDELSKFYHRCLLQMKEAEIARKYLESRELGAEAQEAFAIGYAPNGIATISKWAEKYGFTAEELAEAGVIKLSANDQDHGYHRFGGRLMFTIRDKRGKVVAFSGRQLVASKNSGKYVNSPETLIFKKSRVLFGFDKAAGNIAKSAHHEAIVCEGQIDTIRLHLSGFPVAVASQGTAFTDEHVAMLSKVAEQATLVFDDDEAGHKATIRTAGLMLAADMPIKVVSLPSGDDPDSFLRTKGAAEFKRLLDNAESIMSFQVRVERSKEAKPDSVDAVSRISKALIATIACAKSAVIRAGMIAEAAKLMGLPEVALNEELSKARKPEAHKRRIKISRKLPNEEELDEVVDDDVVETIDELPITGEDAAIVVPPSRKELALCSFLMANEYDETLGGMVGEFLPAEVFGHEFTERFINVWHSEIATGGDLLPDFAAKLSSREHEWFDAIVAESGKSEASEQSATATLQDFIRDIWAEKLRRERGDLPAHGDDASQMRRMELTMLIPRLTTEKWSRVKDIIRKAIVDRK